MNVEQYKEKIKNALGIDENSIIDYELTNRLYKNKTRISEAIKLGLECIENHPNNEFFWKLLGFVYNLNEDFEKSLECAFKSVSINPDDVYNWINLSFAYRSEGEIIISDWMNFNLGLFMDNYKESGFKEMNHENLIAILNRIKSGAICNN